MRAPPRVVLLVLVVALLATGLAVVAVRASGGKGKVASRASGSTTSSTDAGTTSTPSTATSPATTAPPIPSAEAQVLAQIKDQVAQVRQLPWLAPLDIQVASDADFVRQLNLVVQRDLHPDRMQGDGVTWQLLKLIPQNVDYTKAYLDLLSGAVLGFYDPRTKKLLVRTGSGGLTPEQRITVAHEMDHALTDQHFQFGPATDQLDRADQQEAGTAFSGLLEGDAKLLEALWAQKYLSPKERQDASGESSSGASVVSRTPPFLLDQLYFPYTTGRAFVISRWQGGGWAAVDDAYRRPPDSTLVVTHPELYTAGKSWGPPSFPDLAAATGCTPVRANTLGEFNLTELLQEHLDSSTATDAADGWNGDSFATVRCGSARGFADRWLAPDTSAAGKVVSALSSWVGDWSGGHTAPAADGRFSGPKGAGRVVWAGDRVDLVLADDTATADRVGAALGD